MTWSTRVCPLDDRSGRATAKGEAREGREREKERRWRQMGEDVGTEEEEA